jgi:hypothetical protein
MENKNLNIKLNINLLPFCHASIVIEGKSEEKKEQSEAKPLYQEIQTTNHQFLEITYNDVNNNYHIPQTTFGYISLNQ